MKSSVKIVEVGPRDGLQNETKTLTVAERVQLIEKLVAAGLTHLEGGSFVSPKAIPQMVDSEKVWEPFKKNKKGVELSFLVANERGLERALQAEVKSISIFTATSDSFTQKNIGRTVAESLEDFRPIVERAKKEKLNVRGYVSTVFGCPFEGFQNPKKALAVTNALFEMGAEEVSIGDTIGVAHPKQVASIMKKLTKEFKRTLLAGHFHDTRGFALVNIRAAFDEGIRIFDSSIGGLGGCPYAPGSSGNVATEEVAWLFNGMGIETGLNIEKLFDAASYAETAVGRPLRGKFFLSRPKRLDYSV